MSTRYDPHTEWKKVSVKSGTAHVFYAFDVGHSIHLDKADQLLTTEERERSRVRSEKRISKYFDFDPPPIRVTQAAPEFQLDSNFKTKDTIEAMLFDFGAISIGFKIPLSGNLRDIIHLSEKLYENPMLKEHARKIVEHLLHKIATSVNKGSIAEHSEDYTVFQVEKFEPDLQAEQLITEYPDAISSLLRSEALQLSEDEIQNVVSHRISYGVNDVTVVDWNAAFVFDTAAEEICAVLEFANIALLEFSYLDRQLDFALDEFYQYVSKRRQRWFQFDLTSHRLELRKISNFQIDSTTLFEGVANALKLLGDEYLARLYRLASKKLGLSNWDATISRKLKTVESIYEKLSDESANNRLEVLEWIIILLITVSIILPFLLGAH